MMTKARPLLATLLALVLLLGASPSTQAAAPPSEGPAQAIGRTPPRLSYTNGEVSFFRPGAQDWASAQANTPLAPGDELYTTPVIYLYMERVRVAVGRVTVRTRAALGLGSPHPGKA